MTTTRSAFVRLLGFGYAATAYLGFLASFGYFILRTMGYVERWGIGADLSLSPWDALALNAALVAGFAAQHSIMARPRCRQWLQVSHEAKATTVHCTNDALLFAVVSQELARSFDAATQSGLGDDAPFPDVIENLLLRHDPVAMGYQQQQQLEDLRLDRHARLAMTDFVGAVVDEVVADDVHQLEL